MRITQTHTYMHTHTLYMWELPLPTPSLSWTLPPSLPCAEVEQVWSRQTQSFQC